MPPKQAAPKAVPGSAAGSRPTSKQAKPTSSTPTTAAKPAAKASSPSAAKTSSPASNAKSAPGKGSPVGKGKAGAKEEAKKGENDDAESVGSTSSTATKNTMKSISTAAASSIKPLPKIVELTGMQLMSAVCDLDKRTLSSYLEFALEQEHPLASTVINYQNNGGNTPLHMAIQMTKNDAESIELVLMILQMNPDVNAKNKAVETPLHNAVKRDFVKTSLALLDRGCEFWHKDKDGFEPLQLAKDRLIVQALRHHVEMKKEAERNASVAELGEVLFEAIDKNDIKQVKAIIAKQPPEETYSYCPRKLAQQQQQEPPPSSFGHDRKKTVVDIPTALRLAVDKNHLEIVKLLIAAGADGKQCDRLGRTPTMCLCAQKRVPSYPTTKNSRDKEKIRWTLLQALLEGQLFHLESRDKNGETAFILSSVNGYLDDLRLLAEVGADVNARQVSPYPYRGYPSQREKNGDTALILASRRGDMPVVKTLIEELKADIDLQGADGMTAFSWAVWHENKDLILYLHARGADVNKQSWFGQTALMWTMEHMRLQTAMVVLDLGYAPVAAVEEEKGETVSGSGSGGGGSRGKSPPKSSKDKSKKKKGGRDAAAAEEAKTTLVTPGLPPRAADPNITTRNNATPLVVLCRKAPSMDAKLVSACLDLIISRGANLNTRTTDGLTALMWAVINDDTHSCRQLLFCGADPTIVDNLKKLPSEYAKSTTIKMLLKSAVEAFVEQKAEAALRAAELEAEMAEALAQAKQ